MKYYELSAKQKHVKSIGKLGEMYHAGQGCPRNLTKAFDYTHRAADLGNPIAQMTLGDFYLRRGGYYHHVQALKYFKLALNQHHSKAPGRIAYTLGKFEGFSAYQKVFSTWEPKVATPEELQEIPDHIQPF